jgi:hypothetical protein
MCISSTRLTLRKAIRTNQLERFIQMRDAARVFLRELALPVSYPPVVVAVAFE